MRTNSEKYTFFILLQPPKWLYRVLLFGYVRMIENKTSGPVGLMEAIIITSHVPSYICMCVCIYMYISDIPEIHIHLKYTYIYKIMVMKTIFSLIIHLPLHLPSYSIYFFLS